MAELIPEDEIEEFVKKVPEWDVEDKGITRVLDFDEFMEAIDFVNGVAEIAEEANHHPDIDIRWCQVTLRLVTHDVGGLTEADFDLAQKIDNLID